MKRYILSSLLFMTLSIPAYATDVDTPLETLISTESAFTVEETANKLETIMEKKGLTVFARINHTENASKADLDLRPTELIIFGNPKVGTPLMQCSQSVAIDLPQKMLIWQDNTDKVWLSYNNPDFLRKRHLIEGCDKVLAKITKVLGALSKAATTQ